MIPRSRNALSSSSTKEDWDWSRTQLNVLTMTDPTIMFLVHTGSPSRVGDVAVYVFDINQPSLPTPFHSILVPISVFMSLSTLFHESHKFSWQLSAFSLCSSGLISAISVFMALSTVFHSINFPDNSPLSHSVLLVLFLPKWSFKLYIPLWKSPSALIWSFVVDWA